MRETKMCTLCGVLICGLICGLALLDVFFLRNPIVEITESLFLTRYEEFTYANHTTYYSFKQQPISRNGKLCCMVLSVTKNTDQRNAIRQTWGKDCMTFFVLGGKTPPPDFELGDVIYAPIDEVYNDDGKLSSLAIKTAIAIQFFLNHTKTATHVLKTDDDSYISMGKLTQQLTNDTDYWGYGHINSPVIRHPWHRYYVNSTSFNPPTFPTYAAGCGYVLSRKFATCFCANTNQILVTPMEDANTGIAAQKCNVKLKQANKYEVLENNRRKLECTNNKKQNRVIIEHKVKTPQKMIQRWNTSGYVECSDECRAAKAMDYAASDHLQQCEAYDWNPKSVFFDTRMTLPSYVVLANILKSNTHSVVGCEIYNRDGSIVSFGTAESKPLFIETWINQNFQFLTHVQARIICPTSKFSNLRAGVRIKLIIRNSLSEKNPFCFITTDKMRVLYINEFKPKATPAKHWICTGVLRQGTPTLSANNSMLSSWLHHIQQIGATKIMMYIDSLPQLSNLHPVLRATITRGFVETRTWPLLDPTAELIVRTHKDQIGEFDKKIVVGDGKTFYWSQSLAFMDCVYRAASENVDTVFILDTDEFVEGGTISNLILPRHIQRLKWIPYNRKCNNNTGLNISSHQYHRQFTPNQKTFSMKMQETNSKSIMDPKIVLDVDPHRPWVCVSPQKEETNCVPFILPELNHLKTHVAHLNNMSSCS